MRESGARRQRKRGDTMKRTVTQGLLLLVITVLVGTVVGFWQADYVAARKEKAALINLLAATQVEEQINREIYFAHLLEILIRANEEAPFPAFQQAVSELLRVSPARSAVQLSEDGGFASVSSPQENQGGGRSLRSLSHVRTEEEKRSENRPRLVAGARGLRQSGRGLVAYHPVYESTGDFWGFSIVPVDLAEIFKKTRTFEEITRDNYCTVAILAGADSRMVYSNLGGVVDFEPVRTEIRLADGTVWAMTMAPKEGWISLGQRWLNGIAAGLVILVLYRILSNIGKIKRQLVINERMASLDALTNTLNKRAFEQKLQELNRGIEPYGLIFLDLDHFKEINDQYGHDAGDRVMAETANRLKRAMRDVDKVYRVGGDEFVILMAGGLSPEAYDEVRKRIKEDVEGKPVPSELRPLYLHISMGYAGRPADGNTACEVLKVADQRMYEDKQKNHRRLDAVEGLMSAASG